MDKIHFKKIQLITIGAIVSALMFNPMAVEILEDYFKMAYTIIWLGSSFWAMGYLLVKVLTPDPINIPKKKKKSLPVFLED